MVCLLFGLENQNSKLGSLIVFTSQNKGGNDNHLSGIHSKMGLRNASLFPKKGGNEFSIPRTNSFCPH